MKKSIIALAVLLAGASGAVAAADATVTLKIADSLPADHIITKNTTKIFIEKVHAALGDKVKFQHYPAEQLGKAKDLLMVTKSGIADIGYVVPSYVSEKMPLGAVVELPGAISSSCQGALAFQKLAGPGGLLDTLEFKPNGVRVLYNVALSPYQAVFSKRAGVKNLAEFAGKKIRTSPGPMELSVQAVSATPVRMTPPEIFDAMTKGTIDGALLPYTSVFAYGLDQVVGSGTIGSNFGSVGITYAISLSKWNRLSPEVQAALTKAGDEVTRSACKVFDDSEGKLADQLKAKGADLFSFTPQQHEMVESKFDEIADTWAKNLDKRGKKGTEVLNAFRAEVKKVGS